MQQQLTGCAQCWHRKYRKVGHLFQGRSNAMCRAAEASLTDETYSGELGCEVVKDVADGDQADGASSPQNGDVAEATHRHPIERVSNRVVFMEQLQLRGHHVAQFDLVQILVI